MKRKQTRYTSEQEILDAIDRTKASLVALRDEASRLDKTHCGMADEERLRNIEKKVRRIEDTRLPKLKNTLAAFRTETMAFCGSDKGVVLQ